MKLFNCLIIMLCLALVACADKKDMEASIEGKWNMILISENGKADLDMRAQGAYLQFNDQNSFEGNTSGDLYKGFWFKNGNKLQITTSDDDNVFKIMRLTEDSLVLSLDEGDLAMRFELIR